MLFGGITPKTLKAQWDWGEKPKGVQTWKCTVEEIQLLSSAFLLSLYRSDSPATNPGTAETKGETQVSQNNKSLGKQHKAQLAGDKGHTESWCYPNTVTNTDITPSAHKGLKSQALMHCCSGWSCGLGATFWVGSRTEKSAPSQFSRGSFSAQLCSGRRTASF